MSAKHHKTTKRSLLALGAVAALIAVPGSPVFAANGDSNDKQTICHATNADGNQYVVNTPNKNGDVDGHAGHTGPVWNPTLKDNHISWGDIIPPFDYNENGVTLHFAGLNWDANGQAWFANDCQVPITATVDKTNDANGDAAFSDDETTTAVGASVAFKAVITNTSVVPAVLSALTDMVGADSVTFTCAEELIGDTIPAGGSVTCLFTVAGYSPADGASKVNTVTATLHEVGNVENSGSASDNSTVRTAVPPPPEPDISIVKTGPAAVAPGDSFAWTLTVHNDGVVVAPNVTVTDSLPTGVTLVSATGTGWTCLGTADVSCTLAGDLAVDGTSVISVVVTLDAAYVLTTISNTAVVTPTDVTPGDNTSTVVTPVTQPGGGGGGGGGEFTGGGGGLTGGGGGGGVTLPRTGSPITLMAMGAVAMMLAGLGMVLLAPRRQRI